MSGFAWVTLATNDSYSLGALVLAHSLKQAGTTHQLVVLVTPGVTGIMRQKLEAVFNLVQEVNTLDSKDEANLRLLKRPELGITFTKLHCWRLVQFEKCVFLDADTLVLSNCDELFQRDEFSAAPDVGWPDCFNSGVFVYKPSNETYDKLVDFALQKGSFDGGDQGLLNLYFSDWAHKDISKHLPFIYNMCSTATYSYLPAFKQYGKNAKIVHFIGPAKPWLQYFDTETCKVYPASGLQHMEEILQKWWSLFCSSIHSSLTPDMAGMKQSAEYILPLPSHSHIPNSLYSVASSNNAPTGNQNEIALSEQQYSEQIWDPWEKFDLEQIQNGPEPQDQCGQDDLNIVEDHFEHNESNHLWDGIHNASDNVSLPDNNVSLPDNNVSVPDNNVCLPDNNVSLPDNVADCLPNFDSLNSDSSVGHQVVDSFVGHQVVDSFDYKSDQEYSCSDSNLEAPILPSNPIPTTMSLPNECQPTSTIYQDHACLHPDIRSDSGLAGAFAQFTLGAKRTPTQDALENHLRRQAWEVGNIDYLGRDSFDNIWTKICESLSSEQPAPPAEPTAVGDVPSADPTSMTTPVEQVSEKVETPVEAQKAPEPTAEVPQAPTEVTEAPKQAEATIEPTPQLAEPPKPEEVSPVPTEPVAPKTEAPLEEKKEELAQPQESTPVEAAAQVLPPAEAVPEVLPTPTEPQTVPESIPSEVPQSTEAAPPATTDVPPAVIPTESPQEVPSAPETQPEQPTPEVTPEVIQASEVPKSEATEALPATEAVAVAETPKADVAATEPVAVEAQIPEAVATEPIVAEAPVAETPKPEPTPAEPVAAEPPKPEVTPEAPKQEVPTETPTELAPKTEEQVQPIESSPVEPPKPEVTEVPTEVPQPTEVKPEVTEVPAVVPQPTEVKPEEPVAVEAKPEAAKAEAPAIIPEAPKAEPEAPTEAKVEIAVEATPEVVKPAEETEGAAQEPAPKAEGAPKKKIVKKVKKVVKPEGAPKEGSSSAPEGAATPSAEGEEAPPTPPPRKTTTVKKVKAKKP